MQLVSEVVCNGKGIGRAGTGKNAGMAGTSPRFRLASMSFAQATQNGPSTM